MGRRAAGSYLMDDPSRFVVIRDGDVCSMLSSPRSKSEPRSSEIEAIRHTTRIPTVKQTSRQAERERTIQHKTVHDDIHQW